MKNHRTKTENEDNRAALPCPTCGNDDIDTFVWDDPDRGADFVTCLACGTRFNPISGEFQ
jgi:formate dehydrogenase maturation protein FdhE